MIVYKDEFMSLLPTRDRASEKAFLRSLKPHPQESTIVELVEQAMLEKRVQLAAQFVQLIPPRDDEPATLLQARKAAQFLLLHGDNCSEERLYDSWVKYTQRKKMKVKKQGMRPKSPYHRRRPR